jgi:antitoxin CcdA
MRNTTAIEGARSDRRRPTNVTLPADLIADAKRLGINISDACESGLRERVASARRQRWLEENREAIAEYNARVERDGLILARYRQF